MRTKAYQLCGALGATLLAVGCATSGGAGQGFDGRAKQADEKLPVAARFYDEAERALVDEAQAHQMAARKLVEEGNVEKARAEFGAAADRYARFVDTYPASEWRVAFRFKAAEFHLFAQQHQRAADQADKVLADAAANDVSRAMAAQLSAAAWRWIAKQREKAGEIQPIELATAERRGGAPLAPRPPAEPWKHFVDAVDAFLQVWEKHPEAAKRPGERNLALTPWHGALVAAEVTFACDDMEGARRRLEAIVANWPGEADVMEGAVPLLLETFRVRKDDAGFAAARERATRLLEAQASKAQDAKAKEAFEKTLARVVRLGQRTEFAAAKRLADEGRPAEAAEAFERFAAANGAAPDAASALSNAAVAWDAAGRPEKALAAREGLVARHPESAHAPLAALYIAGASSKRDDHAAAARFYAVYIERWPDAPNRCIAMQNIGYELDVQGEKVAAAERYLAFGADAKCLVERSNEAAKALYQGGKLFIEAKQKAKAKEAFEAATRVQGVTDPTALRLIEDAKRQIKRL